MVLSKIEVSTLVCDDIVVVSKIGKQYLTASDEN